MPGSKPLIEETWNALVSDVKDLLIDEDKPVLFSRIYAKGVHTGWSTGVRVGMSVGRLQSILKYMKNIGMVDTVKVKNRNRWFLVGR